MLAEDLGQQPETGMQSLKDIGEKPNQDDDKPVMAKSAANEPKQDVGTIAGIMDFIMPVTSDDIFQDMGLPPKPIGKTTPDMEKDQQTEE